MTNFLILQTIPRHFSNATFIKIYTIGTGALLPRTASFLNEAKLTGN